MKKEIILAGAFAFTLQAVNYCSNLIISSSLNHSYAGDYFSTISLFAFLSTIFSFGAEFILAKHIPLLKVRYSNAIFKNLLNINSYFFKLFSLVLILSIIFSLIFAKIHISSYSLWEEKYFHPSELFLFLIIIIIFNTYFYSLFRAYDKFEVAYISSIIGLLVQLSLIYLCYKHQYFIKISSDYQENLMFNYLLLTFSGYIVSLTLMFLDCKYQLLPSISIFNKPILYEEWKKEIKYFLLNSLQYDWVSISIILLEIFSIDEKDPAIFSYFFAIIGAIYIINKATKQTYNNTISRYLANNDYFKLKRFITLIIVGVGGLLAITSIIIIFFSYKLLTTFSIYNYSKIFILLLISETYNTIFEAICTSFIMLYSKESLKQLTYINLATYIFLIVGGIILTQSFGLVGMTTIFISCSFFLTSMEIILFLKYFKAFYYQVTNKTAIKAYA